MVIRPGYNDNNIGSAKAMDAVSSSEENTNPSDGNLF